MCSTLLSLSSSFFLPPPHPSSSSLAEYQRMSASSLYPPLSLRISLGATEQASWLSSFSYSGLQQPLPLLPPSLAACLSLRVLFPFSFHHTDTQPSFSISVSLPLLLLLSLLLPLHPLFLLLHLLLTESGTNSHTTSWAGQALCACHGTV